jgi:hypothetical protein
MGFFINNKSSKRVVRRTGGKNYVKYKAPTSSSSSSSPTSSFTTTAVLLTSGTSYTVPSGAQSMTAYAIGAGGKGNYVSSLGSTGAAGGGGGVAYRTYSVTGGQTVTYSVSSTAGSDTSITYGGVTIYGFGGQNINGYTKFRNIGNGYGSAAYGPGGGYAGLADGGADGGGGIPINTGSVSGVCGGPIGGVKITQTSCGRIAATDVGGLLAAVALAGGKTTEDCGSSAAFGSAGYYQKFHDTKSSGYGGGGSYASADVGGFDAGGGAVILQFSGNSVSNPVPSFTPQAVVLSSGVNTSSQNWQTYTVPSGCTNMKAWAVGAGYARSAGGCAYKTWRVHPGQTITYSIGKVGTTYPTDQSLNHTWVAANSQGIVGYSGTPYNGGGYAYGDGGATGGMGVDGRGNPNGSWGGSVGGDASYPARANTVGNDVSGLLAAVSLAGGPSNFGKGGWASKFNATVAAGFGAGGFPVTGTNYADWNPVGTQGAVVLYFT